MLNPTPHLAVNCDDHFHLAGDHLIGGEVSGFNLVGLSAVETLGLPYGKLT